MDCRMPILDGIEATRIIRLNKDSVPIVALTITILMMIETSV